MSLNIKEKIGTGVIYADKIQELFKLAKENNFAIPAVNVSNNNSINAVLEAARDLNSPVIIQINNYGSSFFAGKGLKNDNFQASVLGAISAALHVHNIAKAYDIPVILHTDHASKKLLPWIDGIIEYDKKYYTKEGKTLFSSHMLDLSELSIDENIKICNKYLKILSDMKIMLEIELGVTGNEKNNIDKTGIDNAKLYTQPKEVAYAYEKLSQISKNFTIAAAFGNVHGVYKPGSVVISPIILKKSQSYIKNRYNTIDKPVSFVFHGGSGSSKEEIEEAISYGVVKMNIDTDTQWAFWNGIRNYYLNYEDYLQGQIGNPEGAIKPNKTKYDPKKWLRQAEIYMINRLKTAFLDLNCVDIL